MKKKLIRLSAEEDAAITKAALSDPDNPPITEEEWKEILKLVRESGSDPSLVSIKKSYFTSSNTAIVCATDRSQVVEIAKNELGEWNIQR